MRILVISPKNRTVYNFRGDLIREMIALGHDVSVTGPDMIDIEKIEALGVDFHVVPVNKNGTSILGDLKYMLKLRKLVKAIKPDITFAYTIKPVVYGAMAAKSAKVKSINSMITGGGYTFTAKTLKAKVIGKIVKTLYKIGLCKSDNVIFQNPDDKKEFVDLKLVKENKCHVVNGSGVNVNQFEYSEPPQAISFLMISRLLKCKGVYEYLKAAEIVKKKYPEVQFGLLGKYETAMQDAIPKEDVERYINDGIVTRYDETPNIAEYYGNCSVYVLPSYREGTPRTVLEAMSCGRAIITTDVPGCRETVVSGENGFLVPAYNAQAVAEKMINFVENPELIGKMGNAARKIAEEKYDVKKVNNSILNIIKLSQTGEKKDYVTV